ncbi:uncharacterized protein RCO7_07252 [Rhynchosporium graminicola]|uniref:BZIP domain-containing protein n=1 Tax=Rhynchosporium graminicola TaxID=2792576 RepID=A0A1E1L9T1_9HELO|nr:uncharacterized protein RCO7_07252 [Rhynchosporium commune]
MVSTEDRDVVEPFVTLSPFSPSSRNGHGGNTSESPNTTPEDSFDETTPLPGGLSSATHDTRRADYHMKDLESFARDLQCAADRAFPNEGRAQVRYRKVSVILLRWEDDEMKVEWELEDLEKVFGNYGFETEKWMIPSKNSHLKLMSKAVDVVKEHDGNGGLVIVYYAGHAGINANRGATWTCKQDPTYASLEWSAIQTLFEKADFDVLLLLDCCAAASAAPAVGSAVTETIAACGFESIASQPGRCSFTNSLIEVLEDWIDSPPFSAAMLHNKVLSILKHERPERMQNGKRRRIEYRRTPIHIVATADTTMPSIELSRRAPRRDKSQEINPSTLLSSSKPKPRVHASPDKYRSSGLKGREYQPECLNNVQGDVYEVPRVIISLSLEKHQNLRSESCQKWLASCPALIKYAKVEAVYSGFSALLLLSIPVLIWNLLPENVACSFVGYVTSPNFLNTKILPEGDDTSSVRSEDVSTQTSPEVDSPQTCDRCYTKGERCSGRRAGCRTCDEARLDCTYTPVWRREGPSKEYIDDLQRKFNDLEQAFHAQIDKSITLPSIDSSIHTDYRVNAADYDKSLVQRLNGPRPSIPQSERETLSGEKGSRFPLLFYEHSQRGTQSPMSTTQEQIPGNSPNGKISASQAQQHEFSGQQILKRDAILKDSGLSHGTPPPLPPPRRQKDDEASWNDKKLAWIAPKSEYAESKSPSLGGGKSMVRTDSNSSYDSKDWHYPPDKKMKISSVTEASHKGFMNHTTGPMLVTERREMLETRTPDPLYTNFSAHMRNATSSPNMRNLADVCPYARPGVRSKSALMTPNMTPKTFDGTKSPSGPLPRTPADAQQQHHSPYGYQTTSNLQLHEARPPTTKPFRPEPVSSTAATPTEPLVEQDWTYITDIAERRRIQNRNAQRNYRKRLKRRLEDLEDRAGSSSSSRPPDSATSAPHYSSGGSQEQSEIDSVVMDSQPLRCEPEDTRGRYMSEKDRVNFGPPEDMSV